MSVVAFVHNPERRQEWKTVLGIDELPIVSPIPLLADLPGVDNALVYELNVRTLDADQLQSLIGHLADKFGRDIDYTRHYVLTYGVPILANDVTVIATIPWWL